MINVDLVEIHEWIRGDYAGSIIRSRAIVDDIGIENTVFELGESKHEYTVRVCKNR